MSMNVGDTSSYNVDINVTPLVDVMLVILIIFMVITPLLGSGVAVRLPRTINSQEEKKINSDTAVIVSVPEDATWYLGRDNIDKTNQLNTDQRLAALTDRIKQLMQGRPFDDKVVYIKSSEEVHYGFVVQTISAIRDAGIERIGLVVEKEKTGTSAATGS